MLVGRSMGEIENDLTKIGLQIRRSIQDFSLCSTFQEIDQQNSSVREMMDKMRILLQELDTAATETTDKEEKEKAEEMHRGFKDQLTACQRQFRAANLNQMNQLERLSHKELMSGAELRQRTKAGGNREALVSQHSNITNNLKSISRQLASTVERSSLTVSSLEGSSKTLQEVDEEHRGLSGVIGQSKKLITKYMRRESTDKVLIIFALSFFFAVVFYILRKRVFPTYGPLELIFYFSSIVTNGLTSVTSAFS
eukprot:TRINITY_DN3999_c0_g1_i3.p1 TRINITY_DN3999_c0_g1~~TRINITY_DN3999_c0_g1_i3.p1  ORF type:complete len:253 (-),score=24.62 TRINITY_DN3999_c0_g1_i3:434-1192(-)